MCQNKGHIVERKKKQNTQAGFCMENRLLAHTKTKCSQTQEEFIKTRIHKGRKSKMRRLLSAEVNI